MNQNMLPVLRAQEIEPQEASQQWLIHSVWARAGVGIIGGAPKCCKSWLGLDMAVSVASGTPCLGHFQVEASGAVLIYLAEDALPSVRSRIGSLCAMRGYDIASLDLHVIAAPSLRLDLSEDQQRLANTIKSLRPRLLVLDPLVRLHRLDENSASEISNLLGYIRQLQRTFDLAVAIVHHANKKHHSQPGQSLRGSSDLHAFGDSNAYLARNNGKLILTLEHRTAKPPDPFELTLVTETEGNGAYLKVAAALPASSAASLDERIIALLLIEPGPCSRITIRNRLKVNNLRLGLVLQSLEAEGRILKSSKGWVAADKPLSREPSCGSPSQPIPQTLPF